MRNEFIPGELAYHGQGYEEAYETRRADQEEDRLENERQERIREEVEPVIEDEENMEDEE